MLSSAPAFEVGKKVIYRTILKDNCSAETFIKSTPPPQTPLTTEELHLGGHEMLGKAKLNLPKLQQC